MIEQKYCKKVLVVDDEETVLDVVCGYLGVAGYQSFKASDAQLALKQLEANPDMKIIVTDLDMPGLSGLDLLTMIKKNDPLSEIIIVTGYADQDLILKALKEGAIDFIRKPFTMQEILDSMQKAENKINETLQLNRNLEEIRNQNLELLTYKALLEKRAGELLVKQEELSKANLTITELNKNLKKKVDEQVKEIMSKEIAASYGESIQGFIHNLNTPLSTILGGLDILKKHIEKDQEKGVPSYEAYVTRVTKITGAVRNVIKIVKNTMSRSRDENRADKIDLDINKMLAQELEFLEANMFFKHQVDKKFSFAENIPTFRAIYSDISQIIINIIQNALDAMWNSPAKELHIATSFDYDNIYLEIGDSGCGISEKHIAKIFDIFFTTKPTEESKDSSGPPVGNGLGLHMVTQLASQYRIKIDVKSQIDQGTTFIISIPISVNQDNPQDVKNIETSAGN